MRNVPVSELIGDDIAKRVGGGGFDVINLNVRIVQAANVADVYVFFAELLG